MHIDDRLATVLAVSATGDNQIRVQFRQLVDLLGTMPAGTRSAGLDSAMLRLAELAARIPAPERAAALVGSGIRLRNPQLVAELASDHPLVAAAVIRNARLSDEQWLDILPALSANVRGLLRQRADIGPALQTRLTQLGASGPGLPPPSLATSQTGQSQLSNPPGAAGTGIAPPPQFDSNVLTMPNRGDALQPAAAEQNGNGQPGREGIGAIVRRIEAFRRNRETARPAANDAPLLPLVDEAEAPRLQAFAFACDSSGRICWTDASLAGMIVGILLPLADQSSGPLASAFRRRLPVRATTVELQGAPTIAGAWLLDAAPEFDHDGRFGGYLGKFRRPSPEVEARQVNPEAVRVRQILHELRTPVNAIQGFAELIHQQLVGPVPHTYRALAASIASDAAQMLAGFDELERLARLDSAAMVPTHGAANLCDVVTGLIDQLEPFTVPRQSGFTFAAPATPVVVAIAPEEAERLGWRLLATLASAARPGENLPTTLQRVGDSAILSLALPAALANQPDPFEGLAPLTAQAVSGGPFGSGFSLRLAGAEARAAGGSLTFRDGHVLLTLPAAGSDRLTDRGQLPNAASVGVSNTG